MDESPMQPLLLDGEALARTVSEHYLADFFPEICTLADELGECIEQGIATWRNTYWNEAVAYQCTPDSLGDMTDSEWDECILNGYPEKIKLAAMAIFYGNRSASQYFEFGCYKSYADAVRAHGFPDGSSLNEHVDGCDNNLRFVISDRLIYALVSAVEAWWALDKLIKWMKDSDAELNREFSIFHLPERQLLEWIEIDPARWDAYDSDHKRFTVDEWAFRFNKTFSKWMDKFKLKWGLHEADCRESAARRLGLAQRWEMLSSVADDLSQATLDRLSLVKISNQHDVLTREKTARRESSAKGGKSSKWDKSKPAWRNLAAELMSDCPSVSYEYISERIRDAHKNRNFGFYPPEVFSEKCDDLPGLSTIRRAIEDMKPSNGRGAPKKGSGKAG